MKKQIIILLLLFVGVQISAQNVIALTIDGESVSKSEVEKAWNTNPEGTAFDDFIQSFINNKLYLKEAKAQQIDTTFNFQKDYSAFRIQLMKKYEEKNTYLEDVAKKLYSRLKVDVEVNQAFIAFPETEFLLPKDTLELYNQALALRDKAIKTGFRGDGFTDWYSSPNVVMNKQTCNGYLGWLMPFIFTPRVEDVVYSQKLGEVSLPIRSESGYHVIQVLNRRPAKAAREIQMVTLPFPSIPPSKREIDSVKVIVNRLYSTLFPNTDETYREICEAYNEANGRPYSDCSLGFLALNSQYPASVLKASFELENIGDLSEPVLSDYGYHILRLKDTDIIQTYENLEPMLMQGIQETDRQLYLVHLYRENQKKKYPLHINRALLDELSKVADEYYPLDSLFLTKVDVKDDALLVINNHSEYSMSDFCDFIEAKARAYRQARLGGFSNPMGESRIDYKVSTDKLFELWEEFLTIGIKMYADATIESRIPELASQLQEVSNGILLYEVQEQNINKKAKQNKNEKIAYFNTNKSKYKWSSPRYKGIIVYSRDKETQKRVDKLLKSKEQPKEIIKQLGNEFGVRSKLISHKAGIWAKGDNVDVDTYIGKKTNNESSNVKLPFISYSLKELKTPEEYSDVSSLVDSDYLQYLKQEWNKELRRKYKIEINKSVIEAIK